jgi:hypothetical protein
MTRLHVTVTVVLGLLACAGGSGCQLKRPDVITARMIEPRLIEPDDPATASSPSPNQANQAAGATSVRLLETQSRAHIGRRLLHQEANGEIVEDLAWRWSSAPSRYLDSALRLAFSLNPGVRLVDSGNVMAMAVTLIAWHLEATNGVRLVGAVEVVTTTTDRSVHAHVIRGSEPVSSELPGDLATASGRLLQTLASQSLARTTQVGGR